MYFKSKQMTFFILAITSIVLSRTMLLFINDPEGPNLLIVLGLAAVVYALSLAVYAFKLKIMDLQRLLLAILIQILFLCSLYLFIS